METANVLIILSYDLVAVKRAHPFANKYVDLNASISC